MDIADGQGDIKNIIDISKANIHINALIGFLEKKVGG